MILGNFEFKEVIGRDDGKTYISNYISPDGTLEIAPVISALKGTIMPVALQAYVSENGGPRLFKKEIGFPPNNQQDLDEWNFLTRQGLTFDNLPSRTGNTREIVDFGAEIIKKLDTIEALIKAQ